VARVRLDTRNLAALARGCAVLGAGGGGDPASGLVMALRAVQRHAPVTVVRLEELGDDALVMPCGLIGAPAVAAERIPSGDEGRVLRDAVERLRGDVVGAVMCFQIGGVNGLLPATWAARTGLPLVDADGMGRTLPRLDQATMRLAGISASPLVLTDGRGNTVVVHACDDGWAERVGRAAAASLGGVCAGAMYCMPARRARDATVPGTVTLALALGEALAVRGRAGASAAIVETLGGCALIEGRVVDVERRADGGFVEGSATVQGTGADAARQLRLELQNEFLLAIEEGVVRAAVPDVICVLDADTGEPVLTDHIRHGQRVTVTASPGPEVWRSAAGLAVAGPAAFGLDVERSVHARV